MVQVGATMVAAWFVRTEDPTTKNMLPRDTDDCKGFLIDPAYFAQPLRYLSPAYGPDSTQAGPMPSLDDLHRSIGHVAAITFLADHALPHRRLDELRKAH